MKECPSESHEAVRVCYQAAEIDPENIIELKFLVFNNRDYTDELLCFLKCYFQKIKIITSAGKLNETADVQLRNNCYFFHYVFNQKNLKGCLERIEEVGFCLDISRMLWCLTSTRMY